MAIYILVGLILLNILAFIEWGVSFSTIFLMVVSILIGFVFLLKKISNKNKFLNIFYKIYSCLVLIFIVSFVIIEGLILLNITTTNDIDKIGNVDTVIVLGAKVNGYKISDTLRHRLDKSIEYYNKNKDINIIVTGGQGNEENISEALAMNNYLVEQGVEASKIIMEDKATTTLENIIFSKDILEKMDKENDKVLIVTNDYHLFRARLIACILGLENEGLCYESSLSGRLYYMIREYPTMVIDLFRSISIK